MKFSTTSILAFTSATYSEAGNIRGKVTRYGTTSDFDAQRQQLLGSDSTSPVITVKCDFHIDESCIQTSPPLSVFWPDNSQDDVSYSKTATGAIDSSKQFGLQANDYYWRKDFNPSKNGGYADNAGVQIIDIDVDDCSFQLDTTWAPDGKNAPDAREVLNVVSSKTSDGGCLFTVTKKANPTIHVTKKCAGPCSDSSGKDCGCVPDKPNQPFDPSKCPVEPTDSKSVETLNFIEDDDCSSTSCSDGQICVINKSDGVLKRCDGSNTNTLQSGQCVDLTNTKRIWAGPDDSNCYSQGLTLLETTYPANPNGLAWDISTLTGYNYAVTVENNGKTLLDLTSAPDPNSCAAPNTGLFPCQQSGTCQESSGSGSKWQPICVGCGPRCCDHMDNDCNPLTYVDNTAKMIVTFSGKRS